MPCHSDGTDFAIYTTILSNKGFASDRINKWMQSLSLHPFMVSDVDQRSLFDTNAVSDLTSETVVGSDPIHIECTGGIGTKRTGRTDEDITTSAAGTGDREVAGSGQVDLSGNRIVLSTQCIR